MKYRIVEICPSVFEVQYKGIFGWARAERGYTQSLKSAREALTRIKESQEWTPKVYT